MLIVEDDDELRSLIATALTAAGYSTVEAADGAAAIAASEERDPNAILLDLAMPGLSGQAFAEEYRRRGGRAKIVVMSGTATAGETSARIQAAVFLSKPFDLDKLLDAVKRVLETATA